MPQHGHESAATGSTACMSAVIPRYRVTVVAWLVGRGLELVEAAARAHLRDAPSDSKDLERRRQHAESAAKLRRWSADAGSPPLT